METHLTHLHTENLPPLLIHPHCKPVTPFRCLDIKEFLARLNLGDDLASLLHTCLQPHRKSSPRLLRLHLAAHTLNLCRKYRMERSLESIAYYAANGEVSALSPSVISQTANCLVLVCKTCKPFRPRRFEDSALMGVDILYGITYNLNMQRRESYLLERQLINLHSEARLSAVSPRVKVQSLVAAYLECNKGLSSKEAAARVSMLPSTYSRFRSVVIPLVGKW